MDLNDDGNDTFITQNIFRENLDRSVAWGVLYITCTFMSFSECLNERVVLEIEC